jgi:outer membrane cobalamin receptor
MTHNTITTNKNYFRIAGEGTLIKFNSVTAINTEVNRFKADIGTQIGTNTSLFSIPLNAELFFGHLYYKDQTNLSKTGNYQVGGIQFKTNLTTNQIAFSLKRTARIPTINDLYYLRIGNRNLKPEEVAQGEVQWNKKYSGLNDKINGNILIKAYSGIVVNKIIALPSYNTLIWSMSNAAKARIQGLECSTFSTIRINGISSFYINANYAYQKAIDISSSNSPYYKDQIAYIPVETANALLTWQFRSFKTAVNSQWIGFRYALPENSSENRLVAYTLLDASLSYSVKKWLGPMEVKIQVNNLGNVPYQVIRNFPMPGRNFVLSLEWLLHE